MADWSDPQPLEAAHTQDNGVAIDASRLHQILPGIDISDLNSIRGVNLDSVESPLGKAFVMYSRGMVYFAGADMANALECFQKVVMICNKNAVVRHDLDLEAKFWMFRCLNDGPPALLISLGNEILARLPTEPTSALSALFMISEASLRAREERLRTGIGMALVGIDQIRALEHLTDAIERSPTNIPALGTRSLLYAGCGRADLAQNDLDSIFAALVDPSITSYSIGHLSTIPMWQAGVEHILQDRPNSRNDIAMHMAMTRANHVETLIDVVVPLRSAHELRVRVGEILLYLDNHLVEDGVSTEARASFTRTLNLRESIDDLLMFCYNNSQNGDAPAIIQESGFSIGMFCLRFSDLLKSLSSVLSLKSFSSAKDLLLSANEINRVTSQTSAIVCYHVIRKGGQEWIMRWLVQNGELMYWDCIESWKVLEKIVGYLPSLLERRNVRRSLLSCLNFRAVSPNRLVERVDSDDMTLLSLEEQRKNCREIFRLLLGYGRIDDYLRGIGIGTGTQEGEIKIHHITFVPDDVLFRVPFSCLLDDEGQYLIERFALSVGSSLRMLMINQDQNARVQQNSLTRHPIGMMVCGLEEFQSEIRDVTSLASSFKMHNDRPLTTTVLAGSAFVPDQVEELLDSVQPAVFHVVSHGRKRDPSVIEGRHEEDVLYEFTKKGSIVCYSPSLEEKRTYLDAKTFANRMNLDRCRLTYLSCCSLGDGEVKEVGILGFYSSVFEAGCPSVICSLWPAEETISQALALSFYRFYFRIDSVDGRSGTQSIAESLRASILKLLAAGSLETGMGMKVKLRNCPVLWSSFQLFGVCNLDCCN